MSMPDAMLDWRLYVNYTSIMKIYINKYVYLKKKWIKKIFLLMVAKSASLTNAYDFIIKIQNFEYKLYATWWTVTSYPMVNISFELA